MISFRFTRRGCMTCLRLKASSWRVSAAARLRGALDLLDVRAARIAGVEAVEEQVRVAEDRGQHVVEVVRDAAGEAADRLHLLRLAQLHLARAQRLLGLAPLAHVADPRGENGPSGVSIRETDSSIGNRLPSRGSRRARGDDR